MNLLNRMTPFVVLPLIFCGCAPDDGSKDFAAANVALELHDLKKAERLFARSAAVSGGNVDAEIALAKVRLLLGELSAAKECLDKVEATAGGDCDFKLIGAQIAWHEKDYESALRLFGEVAGDSSLANAVRADAWASMGVVHMAMAKPNPHQARVDFLRAIALDGRNPSAWYHLGILYRGDAFGYNEAALDHFNFFVRLSDDASPRMQKVQTVIIPGLKDAIARTATERPGVANRNASASAAALVKAEAAAKRGEWKTARDQYEAALKADALSYPAALGLAKCIRRLDNTRAGQEKAFEKFKLACALRPSAVTTHLEAGALGAKIGMNVQTVEIYSRAVAANPRSPDAIDGLIRALRKAGRAADAQCYQEYRDSLKTLRKTSNRASK